ncbi:MAG: MFS transporter [Holosporales bacterium]|jgi:MFS family permease|nr:MFS transporter [Holosporales bacterium]
MRFSKGFFDSLRSSIPRAVWIVGLSSLLVNVSTSVVFAGSALYLKTVIGVSIATIGLAEALVEAIAYGVRIFSGVFSDYMRRRKPLMLLGFTMLAVAKPMLALSKSFGEVLTARAIDRIGNGIQATPREALISDLAQKEHKGACFGMRQSLAVIGSTIGGIFGIVVMQVTHNDFEFMFILASIPATLAIFILLFFVHEKKSEPSQHKSDRRKIRIQDLKLLGKKFWILMIIVVATMTARFSEVFISLFACGSFELDVAYGTSITIIYNLFSVFVSYPMGKLSDRMNRTTVLFIGIIFLALAHLTIGCASGLSMIFLGTIFWGIQRGITEAMFATLVSDYVPKNLRGTGFGTYYLIVSISAASASALAGMVSQSFGEGAAFLSGACICCFSIIFLLFFRKSLSA